MDHYMPPREEALAPAALLPDPEHVHDLVDLIDLAERANPDTRRAWEEARAAAARLGRVESRYLPIVALAAVGGWQREVKPTPEGTEIIHGSLAQPTVDLTWLLVDFAPPRAPRGTPGALPRPCCHCSTASGPTRARCRCTSRRRRRSRRRRHRRQGGDQRVLHRRERRPARREHAARPSGRGRVLLAHRDEEDRMRRAAHRPSPRWRTSTRT
jgi:hypothetical protein